MMDAAKNITILAEALFEVCEDVRSKQTNLAFLEQRVLNGGSIMGKM